LIVVQLPSQKSKLSSKFKQRSVEKQEPSEDRGHSFESDGAASVQAQLMASVSPVAARRYLLIVSIFVDCFHRIPKANRHQLVDEPLDGHVFTLARSVQVLRVDIVTLIRAGTLIQQRLYFIFG